MGQLRTLLQNMTPKGRLMLAGSAIAIVVLAVLMMRMASAPSYTTVMAGVDPKQARMLVHQLLDDVAIGKPKHLGRPIAVVSQQNEGGDQNRVTGR